MLKISVLCVFVIILSVNAAELKIKPPEAVSLEDFKRGTLRGHSFNGTWLNETSFYYFDKEVSEI
jgi:hypothetical protein